MQESRYYQVPVFRRDGSVRDIAVVDEADAFAVAIYRWHRNSGGYAVRRAASRAVTMHRQLLGLQHGDGLEVDHINRDKLDNRRSNLRIVTHAENARNVGSKHGSTSSFRAVHWQPDKKRWRARVRYQGRRYHLGAFRTEEEAGAAVRAFWLERGVVVD